MNYLAHLYLSGNHPEITIGNFIADHVKGSQIQQYSGGFLEGILLHRQIDTFTDTHEVVAMSKERLRPIFRKYAPVIVDVFYDHFLARDWLKYHHLSLQQFAGESYDLLRSHQHVLPERTVYMLHYMESQNWLLNYATIAGVRRALTGLSKRTTFDSGMERATDYLEHHYAEFEKEFERFFPELRQFVAVASAMPRAI